MAHNPTDNRPFPAGLTCRTCKRHVSANEPSCPDCHRANRVKCPQCGKLVNNHFPYCEFCASPLANDIESPPLAQCAGAGQRREPVVGYRQAGRFVRTTVVGGTFIACACSIGWGLVLMHDVMRSLADKMEFAYECRVPRDTGMDKPWSVNKPSSTQYSPPALKPTTSFPPVQARVPATQTPSHEEMWRHTPEWYSSEGEAMAKSVKGYCAGGYQYDRDRASEFVKRYRVFLSALNRKSPQESDEAFAEVRDAYRSFKDAVAWQGGQPHPNFAHVLSSYSEGCWLAEEGWEFVYPGTSNLTVRRKAPTWTRPKEWYERECTVLEKNVRFYTSGGYRYPRGGDIGVVRQIQNLRQRLNADDPEGSARVHSELKDAYGTFVNQCQWTSGLRHPRFPHVVSGMTANQWVAENGWEFVNPGTSDFTVRRKLVQVRCNDCRGNGYVVQKTRCYSCNGRGRVPNPAAQVGQAVNAVGGLVNAFGGGRKGRHMPRIPQSPPEIRCSPCSGRGTQQQNIRCNKCNGSGIIYR